MKKISVIFLCIYINMGLATEIIHPIQKPNNKVEFLGTLELDEDIYSADLTTSIEYSFFKNLSLYSDITFRFLSYSYEYSTKGYIHNYCNLHVNGFNETYIGSKFLLFPYLGLDFNWRFPPLEGSQKNRFHQMKIEPFSILQFTKKLSLGTSLRYLKSVESSNYLPGDIIGLKASFIWIFKENEKKSNWKFSEIFLYEKRFQESQNKNLAKPYQKMNDSYQGIKFYFDLMYHFYIQNIPLGIGINYEIHKGTLFGFETGHKISTYLNIFNL